MANTNEDDPHSIPSPPSLWHDVNVAEEEDEDEVEDQSASRKVRFNSRRKIMSYPSESSFEEIHAASVEIQSSADNEQAPSSPSRAWVARAQIAQRYTPKYAPPPTKNNHDTHNEEESTNNHEEASDEDGDGDDEENDVNEEYEEVVIIDDEDSDSGELQDKDDLIAELTSTKEKLQKEVERVTNASKALEKAANALKDDANNAFDLKKLVHVLAKSSGKVVSVLLAYQLFHKVFASPLPLLSLPNISLISSFGFFHTIIFAISQRKSKWRRLWQGLAGAITCVCMTALWGRSTGRKVAWPLVVAAGSLMGILTSPSS